jgi:competence protein ComEA
MDDPLHDISAEPSRTAGLARWFQPSAPELAALALLVLGAVVASALLWFQAAQRPSELGSDAASAGVAVGASGATDGPAPGVTDEHAPPHGGGDGGDHGAGAAASGDAEDVPAVADADADVDVPVDVDATVHVTGAVTSPGLVVLPGGSRVGDAVAAAGGLTGDAQEERINLARPLVDGEHVHVPRVGEDPLPAEAAPGGTAPGAATGSSDGAVSADGKVDINRADVVELDTLPGVGPARAEAIIAYREEHGPFAVPGDLRGVSGIGEVIFQQLAELVTVG